MITLRDQYHGAVLRKIVSHRHAQICEIGDKVGHFQIDSETHLLVKYATNEKSPWRFIFRPEDVSLLLADHNRAERSYPVLVCGFDSICLLQAAEWFELLDTGNPDTQQTIVVRRKRGCQFRVSSPKETLKKTVSLSRFPSVLFKKGRA